MEISSAKNRIHRLIKNNMHSDAVVICNKLCGLYPDNIESWLTSANVHAQIGDLEVTIECCKRALQLQPDNVTARYNLAIAYQYRGDLINAEDAFREVVKGNPDLYVAHVALGSIKIQLGKSNEAILVYENLLANGVVYDAAVALQIGLNLSVALYNEKRFSEAEMACIDVLKVAPDSAEVLNNLGQILKEQGEVERAVSYYEKALKPKTVVYPYDSNYLLSLNYLSNSVAKDTYLEHRNWGEKCQSILPMKQHSGISRVIDKRLIVGYVSPDFCGHSVMHFISGLIGAHNRDNVEIICYSDVRKPDNHTERLKNISDRWRDISGVDNDRLIQMIEEDTVDILVDLTGHTANNRLHAFAKKAAPVQVTWLGYPNTTGLTAIDYRITDQWADPPGESDSLNTEQLVRLPDGFLCYKPLNDCPDVSEAPLIKNGYVTYGSFNNISKVNEDVVKLWAELMCASPQSRLILKSNQLTDPVLRQRFLKKFKSYGVDPSRLDIYGRIENTNDHFALYGEIDIALDTFPYNGTTTTCEALWMGVPVVALDGHIHAGRVGVSLLVNIGLEEMIAKSKNDYINICDDLSGNPEKLSLMRRGMRERLLASPLLDAEKFAKSIEAAYRDMWENFCM